MNTWECTGCGLLREGQNKPEGWDSVILLIPQEQPDGRRTDRLCPLYFCENQRCMGTRERIVRKLGIGGSLVIEG